MDDLFSQETVDQVKFKKELERSSKDRIRVYNPTDQDFDVYNDGYKWTVPNKSKDVGFGEGQQVFPRYLAISFVTKCADRIFFDKMDEAVKKENDRRVEKGLARMNKWEEQAPFEIEFSTITEENKLKRRELMSIMWMGIEEEYGADSIKEQAKAPKRETDDDFLRKLASRKAPTMPVKAPEINEVMDVPPKASNPTYATELESKNAIQLQSIARKQGLEVSKTDKKDELIKRLTEEA